MDNNGITVKFAEGQRVRLKEGFGFPVEAGVVVEYEGEGIYCVRVDDIYADDEHDDCLRTVPEDQMEAL